VNPGHERSLVGVHPVDCASRTHRLSTRVIVRIAESVIGFLWNHQSTYAGIRKANTTICGGTPVGIRKPSFRKHSPQLVWSGPEASGPAGDTGDVYEQLFSSAKHSLWVASFVTDSDPDVFGELAANMDTTSDSRSGSSSTSIAYGGRKTGGTGTRQWCGDSLRPFGNSGLVRIVPSCTTIGDPWTSGTAGGSTRRPVWRRRSGCSLHRPTSLSQPGMTTSSSDCWFETVLWRRRSSPTFGR